MILILAAMPQELEAIKYYMEITRTQVYQNTTVYEGTIDHKPVLLALTGIGKVSTAMTLMTILNNEPVSSILNIGSAGGLGDHQQIGDIVIASSGSFHDRFFTDQPDLSDKNKFPCDETMINTMNDILTQDKIPHQTGLMISGDQFLSQKTPHYHTIHESFPTAISVDMESTTVMQVANTFEIPCLVIRSLSDVTSNDDHAGQFDQYLEVAAKQSAKICVEYIKAS